MRMGQTATSYAIKLHILDTPLSPNLNLGEHLPPAGTSSVARELISLTRNSLHDTRFF